MRGHFTIVQGQITMHATVNIMPIIGPRNKQWLAMADAHIAIKSPTPTVYLFAGYLCSIQLKKDQHILALFCPEREKACCYMRLKRYDECACQVSPYVLHFINGNPHRPCTSCTRCVWKVMRMKFLR